MCAATGGMATNWDGEVAGLAIGGGCVSGRATAVTALAAAGVEVEWTAWCMDAGRGTGSCIDAVVPALGAAQWR